MICDICGQSIKGPPFGAIGETLCWDCWSGDLVPLGEPIRDDEPPVLEPRDYMRILREYVVPAEKAGR